MTTNIDNELNLLHTNTLSGDGIIPFYIESSQSLGRVVKLNDAITHIISKHSYPYVVNKVLVELLTLTTAISASLKFKGIFSVQVKSSGPISALYTDISHEGELRGCAQFNLDQIDKIDKNSFGFKDLFSKEDHLAITIDQQGARDRYQGIVSLDKDNFTDSLLNYFVKSEQLETCLKIFSEENKKDHWTTFAILVQKMPRITEDKMPIQLNDIEDEWIFTQSIVNSLMKEEVYNQNIDTQKILHNLFHNQALKIYDSRPIHFGCRCSKEKVFNVLKTIPEEERADLYIRGNIESKCEFCGEIYYISKKELN